ncbi:hypothetical protein [Kineococcus terrestris]|uniref:hypothetical protein n=1 Tax=Kineococcus terrestris TaxID=2044856 RepID=UPI0034DB7A85
MSTTHLAMYAAGLALLLVQRLVVSKRSPWWLGAVLPAAWLTAGVGFLLVQEATGAWQGWAAIALGLVVLLGVWAEGRESREKRLQREDARTDAPNAHHAAGH